jgi:hypothetical protein
MKTNICKIAGCLEPRLGRSSFCQRHHQEYSRRRYWQHKAEHAVWLEQERERQPRKLVEASGPDDCRAIRRGMAEGKKLRRELERQRLCNG